MEKQGEIGKANNFVYKATSGARNIHVMIEFLLIILTDMPEDFIHHEKLFDLLARVGALIGEVSTLVHDLEVKSRNEESTDETSLATLDLPEEKIELLKEDLKCVYLKAPDSYQCCFPMNDGPLFMHLLLIHLNDLLESNAYSIALIKDDIRLVKEALEFIRSYFVNVEQGLYKDLWARVLDVVSQLPEKIPKNNNLIVVKSPKNPVERKSLTTGKIIVGFEEETNWLITELIRGPKDLDVISITGMLGSGKTTLAYKVYNDESVCSHFDLRAWYTVDQIYDEKKLLVKLFNQVTGSDLKFSEEIDVADKLRKQLYAKWYLIVLDDVWDTTSWDDLTRPFPEVEKGSKILLTTRQKKVAFHGKEKRAFGDQSCPDELLDVGKEIAENCKGLPLVADLIAGVIAAREKTKFVWLEVRNNLNSFILNSDVDVMKVIELSFDHLPHHLKPCFLYLASYPKDKNNQQRLVEKVLASLVISFNKIDDYPSCQLHDLVHEFCLIKAREEKLFGEISSSDPSSSSDLMPRIVNIDYDKKHFDLNNFVLFSSKRKRHSAKHLYSLLINGDKMEDRLSDACHLRDLRLLRVLILEPSFIKVKDSLLNEIGMLNHLNFSLIETEVKSLPSSFSNLRNLETLVVANEGSTLVLLPRIWDFVKLRVLSTASCSFYDMDTYKPILIAEDSKLVKLRELGKLMLSCSKDTEDIFLRFHNVQRLEFGLKESWDCSAQRYWFPKLDFLTELDFLRVEFESSNTNDSGPSLATNWGRNGTWGEEDTFVNLKFLKLNEVTLAKWEVGEESFPVLEKLVLWKCHTLEEIPPSFGNICSLKIIKLVKSPQVEDSAKKIKQYVEDMGGDELQVLGRKKIPLFK
ncbi:hypothetical protein P3S67_032346 [Capsicum chacoense]